jgi:hypothetical protein
MDKSTKHKRVVARSVLVMMFLSLVLVFALGIAPAISADELDPVVENVRLVRTPGGITMQLRLSNLPPNEVATVWFLINPGPDFPEEPGPYFSVTRAAGNVIGGSGRSSFAGHIAPGHETMFGPGLQDPLTDQVLLVLITHGPIDPSRILEQLFTPEEDCPPDVCRSMLIMP